MFGQGFFGYSYSTNAAINIISESEKQGADSVTSTCNHDNDQKIRNKLTGLMPQFDIAAARFNAQNPGLNLTASDIASLMTGAAYELNAPSPTGSMPSPWIGLALFTLKIWATTTALVQVTGTCAPLALSMPMPV
jgi:hypothetical protein